MASACVIRNAVGLGRICVIVTLVITALNRHRWQSPALRRLFDRKLMDFANRRRVAEFVFCDESDVIGKSFLEKKSATICRGTLLQVNPNDWNFVIYSLRTPHCTQKEPGEPKKERKKIPNKHS